MNKFEPKPFVLVSGASGFIGAAFLKRALALGWRVRVITRKPGSWTTQSGLEIFEGDLATTKDWTPAVQGVHVVVHAAAEITDPESMPAINVRGPMRLLDSAVKAGVKRWVQLSSVGAYGPVKEGVVSEFWPDRPIGPYEESKSQFDSVLHEFAERGLLEVSVVRPSNVYGPTMRNQSLYHLMEAIRSGAFTYVGPPGASANYVHVDDVVQALELCVVHPRAGDRTFIVSAWATMEQMVSSLAHGAGIKPPTRRINLRLATWIAVLLQWWPRWPLTVSRIQAMSLRSRYCTQTIENELGWRLSVSVQEGMIQLAKAALK